jgi:hypothetical protein
MKPIVYAVPVFAAAALAAEPAPPPAKQDEPIANHMKKPGMKQGDVKKQAAKKEREMKPMLEKEEREMAPATPKPRAR